MLKSTLKCTLFYIVLIFQVQLIRDEQVRQKHEAVAASLEREREHWERAHEEWKEANKLEVEAKSVVGKVRTIFPVSHLRELLTCINLQKKRQYLQDLQKQMELNEVQRSEAAARDSQLPQAKQANKDKIDKIRERKLQQLRSVFSVQVFIF